ncbi:peroxiredoxin family protein [Methylomonas methanica]|uniref:thioredoxin-dependent peroxiredoxin n=1 Tax=Methylomonas methanica (strain DSM 25384 / MC09) TaxID=857087 RepID=F9ZVF3_METMM|nr:peroxiredoxin family protein [Methylomonas methanica]AEG01935.1 alkyl hydroperoxide reductase/ Thiol specific antioxidant/ Mal allergen [Methylomonas methanica MC09]
MNLLKSIFISSYMMLLMVIAVYAGWMLYHGADFLAWCGVLLTSGPVLVVIGRLMLFKNVARTSARFPLINILGAVGVGLSFWAYFEQTADVTALVLALSGWGCFLFYAYWFSSYGGRQSSAKFKVGCVLPNFSVKNAHGATITSAQLTDKPAILIFFRGNWCPLCMAQIKELVGRYREISALGVRVALISPQPHTNTEALAKQFSVAFEYITDEGCAAARALGIAQAHGLPMGMQMMGYASETVLPTVIITDRNGTVIWSHETDNYRIRPEPDLYLDVLRRQGIVPVVD